MPQVLHELDDARHALQSSQLAELAARSEVLEMKGQISMLMNELMQVSGTLISEK